MAPTSAEVSQDKRRWLVISICLHIVVIPRLRGIIAEKIKSVYDSKKRMNRIDTQTHSKYLSKIFPGARRDLNYESINGNDHRDPENFDYKVEDAVSLAKLLVQPFMAKFTAFDDSFDTSAALAVLSYEGLFRPGVTKSAKDVNFNVRTEWAHPDFTKWTNKYYTDCFRFLKDLVSHISVEFPDWTDNTQILQRLQWWKKHGTVFCLGRLDVPDFLRDSLQEVKAFSKTFTDLRGTLSEEVQLQISEALESFKSELRVEVDSLNIRQSKLELNQNQEIKERRDGQDNICDRLSTLESNQEALKEEVRALRKERKGVENEIEVLKKTVLEMQMKLKEKKDVETENKVLKKTVLEMQMKLKEKKDVEDENEVLKKTVLEMQMKLKEKRDVENEIEVLKKTVLEMQMKLMEKKDVENENEVLEIQTQFETLRTTNATFGEQEQIQDSV